MSAITPVITPQAGESIHVIWTPLTEADTCTPISLPGAADKTVQVSGTFGSATIVIQGSNDLVPTNYFTLHDTNGDALSFTAAGGEIISEAPLHIRASTSGGSSSSITVQILAKARVR